MDAHLRLPPPFALPGLIDERSDPDFRRVFGWLCSRSVEVDVALTRIRLGGLDLAPEEVARIERLRLLLAEVNAMTLDVEAHALLQEGRQGRTLRHLSRLLADGVIEVRAAPLAGWSPDFTIFSSASGPRAALLGTHWFERPYAHRGPALAALHGAADARRVHSRFEEAWERAHDISPAILRILERADVDAGDRGRAPAGRDRSRSRSARVGSARSTSRNGA